MTGIDNKLELLVGIVADTDGSQASIQKDLTELSKNLKGLDNIKLGISKDDVKALKDIAKIDFSKLKGLGDEVVDGLGKAKPKVEEFAKVSQKVLTEALELSGLKVDTKGALGSIEELKKKIKSLNDGAEVTEIKIPNNAGQEINGLVAKYKVAGKEMRTTFEQVLVAGENGRSSFAWMPKIVKETDSNFKQLTESTESYYQKINKAQEAGKLTVEQAKELRKQMQALEKSDGYSGISGKDTKEELANRNQILLSVDKLNSKLNQTLDANKQASEAEKIKIKQLKEQETVQERIRKLTNSIVAAQNKDPKSFGSSSGTNEMLSTLQKIDPASKGAADSVKKVSDGFDTMKANAVVAGRESMTVMDSFRVAMEKFPVWMAASTAFYGTVRTIRNVMTEIVSLDSQLTVLRRVSGMDTSEVNATLEESIRLAKELGNTIEDVNEGFISFARQGYRGEELTMLSEYATLLGNISDLSVEDSSGILTAGLKAFNMEAEKGIHIVDSLNEIDNNYSVTTQQLATSMQRAAGTAGVYGMSLERLLGYTGSIAEITRESGSVIGELVAV